MCFTPPIEKTLLCQFLRRNWDQNGKLTSSTDHSESKVAQTGEVILLHGDYFVKYPEFCCSSAFHILLRDWNTQEATQWES